MPVVFARLDISAPKIDHASLSLLNTWKAHFNTRDYEGDWKVLTLRSPGGSADNIFAEGWADDTFADTLNMDSFPSVKALTDSLKCDIRSVRFLNLKAGAVIKQHRDCELAFEKGEARLHFPVLTNPGVEFFVNDIRITMLPGECWYINANMPHRATNTGQTDRVHLVVDCVVNEWLTAIFERSVKTEIEEVADKEQTLMMIQQLRTHGTETADQMADKLEAELQR